MKLRLAAVLCAALFIPFLSGCASDGSLKPDARAKLETAAQWAHRFSAAAHVTIVGVTAACEGRDSKFCSVAMPIVVLADGALALYDKGLAAADAALADTGTPEEQLANSAKALIDLEADVEKYLSGIKATQQSMLGGEGDVLQAEKDPGYQRALKAYERFTGGEGDI